MKIDLVYNYVNGNDEEWVRQRNEYARDNNNSVCRFRDNEELKFSLRSVEQYAPWINCIYIIMDSKAPDWLDVAHDKIRIVKHEEIMPAELLPCYNSNVIETYLTNIQNLSECFIYANDDMMFGNYVAPEFFFRNNKPVVRLVERKRELDDYYNSIIVETGKLMEKKYGTCYRAYPYHNMDAYSKSGTAQCLDVFEEEFKVARKNRLRGNGDIERILFQYFYLEKGIGKLELYHRNSAWDKLVDYLKIMINPAKYFDFFVCETHALCNSRFRRHLFDLKPRVFCVNDGAMTSEADLLTVKALLEKKFPKKSSYEK